MNGCYIRLEHYIHSFIYQKYLIGTLRARKVERVPDYRKSCLNPPRVCCRVEITTSMLAISWTVTRERLVASDWKRFCKQPGSPTGDLSRPRSRSDRLSQHGQRYPKLVIAQKEPFYVMPLNLMECSWNLDETERTMAHRCPLVLAF